MTFAATPPSSDGVLAATLRALPADERGPLLPGPSTTPVPFSVVTDRVWLTERVSLLGRRWRTDDPRVLATLWWYSASAWFQAPSIASLIATGSPLSPGLSDVTAHSLPDGRITGSKSTRLLEAKGAGELDGGAQHGAERLGVALREVLEVVIPLVAAVGRMKERSLWAIASDSTANRCLWMGRALGEIERVTQVAGRVADAAGPPLPRPRWVDVVPMDDDGVDRPDQAVHRFSRRSSCCLIYRVPHQEKCGSCPKRAPDDRLLRMRSAASVRSLEP